MTKVLLICPYSYPSACGIWKRVEIDALALKNAGFDVTIFSSNILKGTADILPQKDKFKGINIQRFNVKFKIGGNAMFFFFPRAFLKLRPHIVHVHGYRYPHGIQAILLSFLTRTKRIITTHGPFFKDPKRPILVKIFDRLYDLMIGWWEFQLYSRFILIAKWEEAPLRKRLASAKKFEYISNGANAAFLENRGEIKAKLNTTTKPKLSICFMGRIDPVKRPEWVLEAAKRLPSYSFTIMGPLSGYSSFTSDLPNVKIILKKYSEKDFIETASNHDIFLMPSVRESFGITLVEAMSQGLLPISTKTKGAKEIIQNGVNGFLVNNVDELVAKIELVYKNWAEMLKIRTNAVDWAGNFSTEENSKKLVEVYKKLV